jgi:predicted transcriptional regulator
MPMRARELMEDPDFVDFEASVEEVEKELSGAENTLIVRKNEGVVGEIHENSLLKAFIPEDELDENSVVGLLGLSFDQSYVPEKAEDLMNTHDVSVDPEEELGDIALIMHREDVRAVPVEEDGEVIGVVHENKVVEKGEVT